jgi:hypothetical protein
MGCDLARRAPHWYVVRRSHNAAAFDALAEAIKKHAVDGDFYGRPFRYFYPGDRRKYWHMGNVINRTVF